MKSWVAIGVVLLATNRAFAQQQEDPVERSLQRLKDQLTLTEEQIPKVREILKKQHEDVKGVLTDAQKTTYDQGGNNRGNRGNNQGGNNNNNNGGGFGNFRGSWLPATTDLKTSLSLTDDQVTKINEIRDAVRQEMRTFFTNRPRGGNPGADFQAFLDKSKEDTTKKIKDTLTDEQKPKFDEALKAFAEKQTPAAQTQDFATRRAGSLDDRVTRVMENLKIENAKEADAVKGLVKKVMELMDKLDAYQRDSRTQIDEAAKNKDLSDAAVGDKIQEILKGHHDLDKSLATARKELTDVVTNRQELELLRRGILR